MMRVRTGDERMVNSGLRLDSLADNLQGFFRGRTTKIQSDDRDLVRSSLNDNRCRIQRVDHARGQGGMSRVYLARQLQSYDGSLVLAAAAYNAGPGNANKWIKAFGDPRADNVDPVIWVELIPNQETRKYVQRVLGNYLVYRARLGDVEMTIKEALRRIPG